MRLILIRGVPVLVSLLFGLACTGQIDTGRTSAAQAPPDKKGDSPGKDGGSGTPGSDAATATSGDPAAVPVAVTCNGKTPPQPLTAKVWKLTEPQLTATLESLLPTTGKYASEFGTVTRSFGRFSNQADRLDLSLSVTSSAVDAAMDIGLQAVANLRAGPYACLKSISTDAACLTSVMQEFGKRAFRRPLTATEMTDLSSFFQAQLATLTPTDAWAQTFSALLLSPPFFFRTEVGTGGTGAVNLTPYEMASFLSYSLVDGPPDDPLLAAAASGQLATKEQRQQQGRRLLASNGGKTAAAARTRFMEELFTYGDIVGTTKDSKQFPTFSATLATDLVTSADQFVTDILTTGPATFERLLTAKDLPANSRVGVVLGVPAPSKDPGFVKQSFPAAQRGGGLLTHPSFLASLAKTDDTNPVRRGRLVHIQLLCRDMSAPPPSVPPLPDQSSKSPLMRDRLTVHSSDPFCAACHHDMDPVGLAFETYDALGQYRTTQSGLPINTAGSITLDGKEASFRDVPDLARQLAGSDEARTCFVRQQARFVSGTYDGVDECQVRDLARRFATSGGDLNELFIDLITDDVMAQRLR